MTEPIAPDLLYRRCDPAQFSFSTTAELDGADVVLGQDRAIEALRFGLGMRREGYNLFVLGPQGSGRHALADRLVRERAAGEGPAADWCYVNDFEDERKPNALRLPPGTARALANDMEHLVQELKVAIPAAFESEDYRNRKLAIENEVKEHHESALEDLSRRAREQGVALIRTPAGFGFAPIAGDGVLSPDAFQRLPAAERDAIERRVKALHDEMEVLMQQLPTLIREGRTRLRELNREVAIHAVGHLIEDLERRYTALPEVVGYLKQVQEDVLENVDAFLGADEGGPAVPMRPAAQEYRRYRVNVMVDNGGATGAPVVVENNPTYHNLIGEVEHIAHMGALVTDFSLIKAGALLRANSGYLLLDAEKLLPQPFAWEALKRTLRTREIRIESLGQALSLVSTISLEPEPIPINVKVVLIGSRTIYYLLSELDPEFATLFKIAADFEEEVDRSPEATATYASLIGRAAASNDLLPLDREGVARVIEHAARLADDSGKLTLRVGRVIDLLREADHLARKRETQAITAADVQAAIDGQIRRADRMRQHLQEEVLAGTILIDTEGARVGQINGLSVIQLGGFAFGRPTRITARVRVGKGEVVDIEREVELGGPLHSKGVLILSSFLAARYSADRPLALSASLVFEQSYGGVDGDSASSAELYALLSSLAEVPIQQQFAVTGSVNQMGEVQAIGGVNEKIEGFFDLCQKRGLTGQQGVLIPASNARHLMLRADVVAAAAAGRFRIFAVHSIDQGIELLTGVSAGERAADGSYPVGSINHRVAARLTALSETLRQFTQPPRGGG